MSDTTLADAVGFITLSATQSDLDRIYEACKIRSKALRSVRAASVSAGDTVKIRNISPKALVGLTGKVVEHDGKHGRILLDATSTTSLRYSRTRYATAIPSSLDEYLLPGVPLSCCEVIDA